MILYKPNRLAPAYQDANGRYTSDATMALNSFLNEGNVRTRWYDGRGNYYIDYEDAFNNMKVVNTFDIAFYEVEDVYGKKVLINPLNKQDQVKLKEIAFDWLFNNNTNKVSPFKLVALKPTEKKTRDASKIVYNSNDTISLDFDLKQQLNAFYQKILNHLLDYMYDWVKDYILNHNVLRARIFLKPQLFLKRDPFHLVGFSNKYKNQDQTFLGWTFSSSNWNKYSWIDSIDNLSLQDFEFINGVFSKGYNFRDVFKVEQTKYVCDRLAWDYTPAYQEAEIKNTQIAKKVKDILPCFKEPNLLIAKFFDENHYKIPGYKLRYAGKNISGILDVPTEDFNTLNRSILTFGVVPYISTKNANLIKQGLKQVAFEGANNFLECSVKLAYEELSKSTTKEQMQLFDYLSHTNFFKNPNNIDYNFIQVNINNQMGYNQKVDLKTFIENQFNTIAENEHFNMGNSFNGDYGEYQPVLSNILTDQNVREEYFPNGLKADPNVDAYVYSGYGVTNAALCQDAFDWLDSEYYFSDRNNSYRNKYSSNPLSSSIANSFKGLQSGRGSIGLFERDTFLSDKINAGNNIIHAEKNWSLVRNNFLKQFVNMGIQNDISSQIETPLINDDFVNNQTNNGFFVMYNDAPLYQVSFNDTKKALGRSMEQADVFALLSNYFDKSSNQISPALKNTMKNSIDKYFFNVSSKSQQNYDSSFSINPTDFNLSVHSDGVVDNALEPINSFNESLNLGVQTNLCGLKDSLGLYNKRISDLGNVEFLSTESDKLMDDNVNEAVKLYDESIAGISREKQMKFCKALESSQFINPSFTNIDFSSELAFNNEEYKQLVDKYLQFNVPIKINFMDLGNNVERISATRPFPICGAPQFVDSIQMVLSNSKRAYRINPDEEFIMYRTDKMVDNKFVQIKLRNNVFCLYTVSFNNKEYTYEDRGSAINDITEYIRNNSYVLKE